MVTLDPQDFQTLVNLLKDNSLMQDARSRRVAMTMAGLDKVTSLLDMEGPPFVVVASIVDFLAGFGRLTYDNEALGLFLNAMKPSMGLQQQDTLAQMMTHYNMMVPIAPSAPVAEWKNPMTAATVVEKVFGENTLHPIAFLERGLEVARSVMYLSVQSGPQSWSGTGFLVAPGLGMTNHHVLPDTSALPGTIAKFNYQETFDGKSEPTDVFKAKVGGLFHANQDLDYAVFEVENEPGQKWGYLPLAPRDIQQDERINIIQHPYGQPKQITFQNNLVEYVGGNVLQYVTATNPGSSGSPVLNDQWLVVGLHHSGGAIPEPTTGKIYNRNEGILISKILADLPADVKAVVDDAAKA